MAISLMRRVLPALFLLLALLCASACAQIDSRNPLLTPIVIDEHTPTEDEFLNILLLGIDYGGKTYATSGGKRKLEDCHTDGVVVLSINKTKRHVALISIPRDSLTYVPGVRGVYKLNAAINCAQTLEEGFLRACDAASWHLAGVEIDKYIAVDATALVALGDAIGGVDFEMDMSYRGGNGYYRAGMQHLDGKGIMDYMRARTNATKDSNDLGRTRRQREMLRAIITKLRSDPSLLSHVISLYNEGNLNIFTNLNAIDALEILAVLPEFDIDAVELQVLTGPYRAFAWNFTFNNQENRTQVIRDVYGIEAEPLPYVSYDYTKWLTEYGMTSVRHINLARKVRQFIQGTEGYAQHEAYIALDQAIDACILAFDDAADTQSGRDNGALVRARKEMRTVCEAAAEAFDYPDGLSWGTGKYWYNEPLINEYQLNWN